MKCCYGNDSHHENEQKGKLKRHITDILMMILCCVSPIILGLLLPLIGNAFPGASIYISKIALFLCPVMMLVMILMLLKKDEENNTNQTH